MIPLSLVLSPFLPLPSFSPSICHSISPSLFISLFPPSPPSLSLSPLPVVLFFFLLPPFLSIPLFSSGLHLAFPPDVSPSPPFPLSCPCIFADAIDNGQNKKAVQMADKILKKQDNLHCAKVLIDHDLWKLCVHLSLVCKLLPLSIILMDLPLCSSSPSSLPIFVFLNLFFFPSLPPSLSPSLSPSHPLTRPFSSGPESNCTVTVGAAGRGKPSHWWDNEGSPWGPGHPAGSNYVPQGNRREWVTSSSSSSSEERVSH